MNNTRKRKKANFFLRCGRAFRGALGNPRRIVAKNLKKRALGVVSFLIILGFGGSIFSLAKVQLVQGEFFRTKAETQQLVDTVIPANRGVIYDRNMTVLAKSATAWKVSLNATAFAELPNEAKEEAYKNLMQILGLTREYLEDKASYTQYNSITIKTKIEKAVRDSLAKFTSTTFADKDGDKVKYSSVIMIDDDVKRYYPYSTLASQVLGFTGTDNTGLWGLESYYNSTLTGVDGRVVTAGNGASAAKDNDYQTVYEAKQGKSLVLTVDETIQRYLEDALDECYETSKCASCYGIVMDVKTGGILAMSTKSDFDLNDPYTIYNEAVAEKIAAIEDEEERNKAFKEAQTEQWGNKTVSESYEPGSVFKVITMAAGLEENVVKYDELFTCTGSITILDTRYNCHNHSGHGTETLTQGLMNSCNPYFITIGQRLGVETFYKYFEAFGFTEKTGIDMPGEVSPTPGVSYHTKDKMSKVNLASTSFGQSFEVSAIQMLTAINAVANGGKLMKPFIVDKTLDENGNVVSQTEPVVKRQVISESTAEKIIASMEQVSTGGTAKNSYVAGYHVAGKTGTSDKLTHVPEGEDQVVSSFAGCAPAYDPQISIIVAVDDPEGLSGGGVVAAPVAAEVIENTLTYLNTERQYNDSEKDLLDRQVPNLSGKTVDEAVSLIKEADLKVRLSGDGESVISQMPAYGQYIPQGGVVVLYTTEEEKKLKVPVPDFTGMTVSQVNSAATDAGINVKISGNSMSSAGLTAYRQSIAAESEIECGSTVTVYFRTTSGVSDND